MLMLDTLGVSYTEPTLAQSSTRLSSNVSHLNETEILLTRC